MSCKQLVSVKKCIFRIASTYKIIEGCKLEVYIGLGMLDKSKNYNCTSLASPACPRRTIAECSITFKGARDAAELASINFFILSTFSKNLI
jgi:hypothetical protein